MHNNIVFSPLYTVYSTLFVFYLGCLYIVKQPEPFENRQYINTGT